MRRSSGSDSLAHSFTDLMTSLMVIFILLLLVFVNNQASATSVTAENLLSELRKKLEPQGFKREDIRIDPKDPSTILLTMQDAQITFQPNSHELQPQGEKFIATRMPTLAAALCDDKYRDAVQDVVVEGHSDNAPYRGASVEESQARNLKLSQERSMEVVEKTLTALPGNSRLRDCLLEKIAASGRGEQGLADTADQSRRAVIKIRVNASHAASFASAIAADRLPAPPSAASRRILDILDRLQAKQKVSFHFTEDEVNQYLVYALVRTPRPGITSVRVKFFAHDYLSTLTVIDFTDIPGFPGLSGKREIWLDLRFSAANGKLGYKVEKAVYQYQNIPGFLAQKLLETLAARQPEGFKGSEGIPLPLGLTHVHTGAHYIEGEN